MLIASLIFWGGATAAGRVLDIREYGAIPFSKEANVSNAGALNASFLDAQVCTLLVLVCKYRVIYTSTLLSHRMVIQSLYQQIRHFSS